jgi:phage portal protein BeeE
MIQEHTAKRLKEYWQTEFAGENAGKIAVLGDGLKFEPMAVTAMNAQLVEQLQMTAQMVCSAFGVPAYMVGVGSPPAYNNIEALNQQYYSQCLQKYYESIEILMDEGLGLVNVPNRVLGTEFNLDDLLRMDTMTMIEAIDKAVKAGVMKPNEGRARLNYGPVEGGDAAYLQQQNFSLAALAKRDAKADPFAKTGGGGGGFGGGGGGNGGDGGPPPPDSSGVEEASMADIELARHRLKVLIEQRVAA